MNYKDTLHLPKTDFPMKADLVTREPERLKIWEEQGLYAQIQEARKDAPLFVLHDGPPFANGDVHMGTALNKVLKDLIVKSKTMAGFRSPFVPGWDCHGLPIEFKVVKESRGLSPVEVRRKSEEYARKFIDVQRGQFKRLGVFGTWADPYLTLAPGYEAEIIRAFAKFVEKGLVYQSKKPVYWSTGAQTALAEAEVEYADRDDQAIFVKFDLVTGPLAGKASMVIWTTTPWTLPANAGIAVHPEAQYVKLEYKRRGYSAPETFIVAAKLQTDFARALIEYEYPDKGYFPAIGSEGLSSEWSLKGKEMAGWEAQHPFLDRRSPIIAADFVTMDAGTGQVHVAPGHGADDYVAGVENGLPILSPVDDQGRFTEEVGVPVWAGKYVFDANKEVIEFLRERGALLADKVYKHSYPHCWRSKTPIVFRAVEQFFVRIDALRQDALSAIDGVTWLPSWGRNRIYGTVESRPDWCISRQRSWGVPLPVFYRKDGKPELNPEWIRKIAALFEKRGSNVWFEMDDEEILREAGVSEDEIRGANLQLSSVANLAVTEQDFDTPEIFEKIKSSIAAGVSVADIKKELNIAKRLINRRNDTLDVWIDSGVSHTAVTAKRPELGGSPVADVYIEATDQHRGWFQSSLMTSIALYGQAPYKSVITHGFVVDKDSRKKVSKSEQGTYAKPMNAEHFVGKYGADIVRLWASSVDYQNEVPFSEESFKGLTDAYRSFRNILRILLANLDDFDVAQHAVEFRPLGETGGVASWSRGVSGEAIRGTLIDRWVLSRLQEVTETCRKAYAEYDFRKVFQTLNQFVTVDISSLYVDITKDRLYCDAANSPRRRVTQTVMARALDTLARLLAPILVFTADEAWQFSGRKTSVHLEQFPEPDAVLRDTALEAQMEQLLNLRGKIGQAVEGARGEKLIGNALEGAVTLQIADQPLYEQLSGREAELEELFILSDLSLAVGGETSARVIRTTRQKCARCWRHRKDVGVKAEHPELCERCADVVEHQAK